jgi:hypothetical protein
MNDDAAKRDTSPQENTVVIRAFFRHATTTHESTTVYPPPTAEMAGAVDLRSTDHTEQQVDMVIMR